jgi:hypothetical protein
MLNFEGIFSFTAHIEYIILYNKCMYLENDWQYIKFKKER